MSRKLSDVTGADALAVMADIVDLLDAVRGDGGLKGASGGGEVTDAQAMRAASSLLRRHPDEVLRLVADVQGVPVEQYRGEALPRIVADVMAVLTDGALADFLPSGPTR